MLKVLIAYGLLAVIWVCPMARANARRVLWDAVEPGGNYAIRAMRGIDFETSEEVAVPNLRVRLVSNQDLEFDLLGISVFGGDRDVAPWLEHRESFWEGRGAPVYHFSTFFYEFDYGSATITHLRQTPLSNGVNLTKVYLLKYGHQKAILVGSDMNKLVEDEYVTAFKEALAVKTNLVHRYSEEHIKAYGLQGPFSKFKQVLDTMTAILK